MNKNEVSYNTVPHYIARDFRSGELTLNERRVLLWLRCIGNPYGIASTSLEDLLHDALPEVKKNTVNTVLLSLRQKQYIYFEPRQGKSGSFDIHLNHWIRAKKSYKTLDKFFKEPKQWTEEDEENSTADTCPQMERSEIGQKFGVQNQEFQEARSGLIKAMSANPEDRSVRSPHNEHDTEHQIDINGTLAKKPFKRTPVAGFVPSSYEEQRCHEMAVELREELMNPILSVLRRDGFPRLEQAWESLKENRTLGKQIDNPAAYLFGIIKKMREQ